MKINRLSILSGTLTVALIAFISSFIQHLPFPPFTLVDGSHPIESMAIGLLLGIFISNTITLPEPLTPGITFSTRFLLSLGIVLLGFKLDIHTLFNLPIAIPIIIILTSLIALFSAIVFGRLFKCDKTTALLIGLGNAICGSSAIMATLGPGATNMLTGVAQANMDNSPLVAIIGQAETERLHKESHQNMDSVEMYREVTKWSTTIREASSIPEVISKAFKIATSGNPGAVLIELPEDIAKHDTDAQPLKCFQQGLNSGTTEAQIEQALTLLEKSKKPLLFLGDGAVRMECDDELARFLELTQLYCTYTFMGKGAISHLHEHSLHCVGLGMKDLVIKAFEEADLVICVGYDMVEYPPSRWNCGVEKKIIHINSDIAEVDAKYIPDIEMVGNIKTILNQINAKITPTHQKDPECFSAIQKKIQEDIRSDKSDDGYPMKPKRILNDIREVLGDRDMLVSDVGAHKMWVARQYGARHSKTCFISNGFCSMGGSMPVGPD